MKTRGGNTRKSLTESSHKPKRLKRSHSLPDVSTETDTPDRPPGGSLDLHVRCPKKYNDPNQPMDAAPDYTQRLSLEMLCNIMANLPLCDVMKLECLSRKLHEAVMLHLKLLTKIDFTEGCIYGWMPEGISDEVLMRLLLRCPELEAVYGFHPINIAKRRQRVDNLSVPGVIAAFKVRTFGFCLRCVIETISAVFLLFVRWS